MVYLDNAATTQVSDAALKAATDAMTVRFGNPSSLHTMGIEGERIVENARSTLAKALGCDKSEVYFTSGGTEGNNIAVFGAAQAGARTGKHIVVSSIEHASVLEAVKHLEQSGWRVSYVNPEKDGHIQPEKIENAVEGDTALVSVMSVNNEVGAVEPVKEICRAVRRKNANTIIHSDGVQGFFKLDGKLCETGADIITISGHKIHAPKGIGAMYIKKGVRIPPRVYGGGQERGMRSGTEPVPLIAALGTACEEWMENGGLWRADMHSTMEYLLKGLGEIEGVTVIPGHDAPHIVSISAGKYPSEVVMRMLEQKGICVSSGSACSKGKRSHVLRAMCVSDKLIDSAVRISLCHGNTTEQADELCSALKEICKRR